MFRSRIGGGSRYLLIPGKPYASGTMFTLPGCVIGGLRKKKKILRPSGFVHTHAEPPSFLPSFKLQI